MMIPSATFSTFPPARSCASCLLNRVAGVKGMSDGPKPQPSPVAAQSWDGKFVRMYQQQR